MHVLRFRKDHPNAQMPTRGSPHAAGLDLYAAMSTMVPARGKAVIDTGIQVALPYGCYGRVAPRSGMAVKNFIDVGAGVVDGDYRGRIGVVLFNHGTDDYQVQVGDRVAQLICERIYYPQLVECETLTNTFRGDKCYGSTGR